MASYLWYTLFLSCFYCSFGARILGIFPFPAYSHQGTFLAIMKALAAKGHHVTVITTNPQKVPIENYTDIDLSFSYKYWRSALDIADLQNKSPIDAAPGFFAVLNKLSDIQLASPPIQELIKSKNLSFDLVIMQKQTHQSFYGLIHLLGSPPVVSVVSMSGGASVYYAMGSPFNPAYTPEFFTPYSDHMSFWQRFHNTYVTIKGLYYWHYHVYSAQEALMRKYFGSAPPSVYEAEYNDSLMLTSHHWFMNYPRPMAANVIEVTGLHIETTRTPLPEDIKHFLDGAKDGAIYFSLGSCLRSSSMPEDKFSIILEVFSELPQRILWKWEEDSLPGQPGNVMVRKWFDQQDVLAHPNVLAFITHGGLQSFQEAVYHGVPLIGIPFFSDQPYNARKFEIAKIGIKLDFKTLTKDIFLEAIRKIINESSYHDNMKKFSDIFREEQGQSLDRAIWWIEYVLRHNGARHLRSAALDLTWYQYFLLDVIGVVLVSLILIVTITYIALKKLISYLICSPSAPKRKTQ